MQRIARDDSASERILETAFLLLSERGYASVSLRDVAQGAHVAVSQIAYHFRNKAGLFLEVTERMVRLLADEVQPYLARAKDRREWVQAMNEFARNFVDGHPQYVRVMIDMLDQSQWEPEFREKIADLSHRFDDNALQTFGDDRHAARATVSCMLGMLLGASVQATLGARDALTGLEYGTNMILSAEQA